jgi:hypothetical protein
VKRSQPEKATYSIIPIMIFWQMQNYKWLSSRAQGLEGEEVERVKKVVHRRCFKAVKLFFMIL